MKWDLLGLWQDTRGTSGIETAIIVPALCLLACGGADVGLGFTEKLRAQQGADRAVQFALSAGLTNATEALIRNEAATGAGVPAANVAVNFWLECNTVVQSDFNAICASGSPARFLSVTVTDSYSPMFAGIISVAPIPLQGFAEGRLQ